jgi:Rieske Fe-S protein
MGCGLLAGYGVLLVESGLFLSPPRSEPKTRRLFVGKVHHFKVGQVKKTYDLRDSLILIKRNEDKMIDGASQPDFQAFSSVCPHLGCRVHWEEESKEFLCPCHNGVFDADGVAISGPPAQANQNLFTVPVRIDSSSQRVYIEVRDV